MHLSSAHRDGDTSEAYLELAERREKVGYVLGCCLCASPQWANGKSGQVTEMRRETELPAAARNSRLGGRICRRCSVACGCSRIMASGRWSCACASCARPQPSNCKLLCWFLQVSTNNGKVQAKQLQRSIRCCTIAFDNKLPVLHFIATPEILHEYVLLSRKGWCFRLARIGHRGEPARNGQIDLFGCGNPNSVVAYTWLEVLC
jgi:hypothetical protein